MEFGRSPRRRKGFARRSGCHRWRFRCRPCRTGPGSCGAWRWFCHGDVAGAVCSTTRPSSCWTPAMARARVHGAAASGCAHSRWPCPGERSAGGTWRSVAPRWCCSCSCSTRSARTGAAECTARSSSNRRGALRSVKV